MRCIFALTLTLLLSACPSTGPVIEVSPESLDFGEVPVFGVAAETLEVTNSGDEVTTVVFDLAGDGPFSVLLTGAVEISPGDSRLILVETVPLTTGTTTDFAKLLWGDQELSVGLSVTGVAGGDDDGDGFASPEDCDDTDPDINPDALEECDGVDNDCSGVIDDDADVDDDGSYACFDCDDVDDTVSPDLAEVCDHVDNNCDLEIDEGFDADEDGVSTCDDPADCDDDSAQVFPGAAELCNGLDDDCDGEVDEDFLGPEDDIDQDGEPGCSDCDDTDPAVNHAAIEVCNAVDDDCDGTINEHAVDLDGDTFDSCDDCDDSNGAINPAADEVCEDGVDDDCTGVADDGCSVDSDGDGSPDELDCDDGDDTVYPGAPQLCDGILDNDCDLTTDTNEADADTDLESVCAGDCDDTNAAVNTSAAEVCDGVLDNDCDSTDDPLEIDNDTDGETECDGDCDDGDTAVNTSAAEVCDGVLDNNCDGTDDVLETDDDADLQNECDGDCDDGDIANYDGNTEICDGGDNDCDGDVDEALLGSGEACAGGSCLEILNDPGSAGGDGLYWLEEGLTTYQAWCDMTRDGGGWTLAASVVNDGNRSWDSVAVWTDDTTLGDVTLSTTADHKSIAFSAVAGDDLLIVTDEYAFSFNSVLSGADFAAFMDGEYNPSSCSTDILASGSDFSEGLSTAAAEFMSLVVGGLDSNASCFPGPAENAMLTLQLANCCAVFGLGNTPAGSSGWETYDNSLMSLATISTVACDPSGGYPCNDNGWWHSISSFCFDSSCKTAYGQVYVR